MQLGCNVFTRSGRLSVNIFDFHPPQYYVHVNQSSQKDLQMLFKFNLILFAVHSVNFKVTEFQLLWILSEIYHCAEGQRKELDISKKFYS